MIFKMGNGIREKRDKEMFLKRIYIDPVSLLNQEGYFRTKSARQALLIFNVFIPKTCQHLFFFLKYYSTVDKGRGKNH